MSRPESVSSRIASLGSSTAIWRISLRFFSPPEKPAFTDPAHDRGVHLDELELLLHEVEEVQRVDLLLAARLADLVVRRAQEVRVGHAGDLDRILEREEDAGLRAHLRLQLEEVLPVVRSTVPPVTSYAGWPASTCASVLLPEPFGPMTACTSPAFTVRSMPLRISLSPALAREVSDFEHSVVAPYR